MEHVCVNVCVCVCVCLCVYVFVCVCVCFRMYPVRSRRALRACETNKKWVVSSGNNYLEKWVLALLRG